MSYGEFLHVDRTGATELWTRLPLGDIGGRNEAWLRDLLQSDPRLIPIADIDSSFGPLTPVCTEMHVGSGYIDNVFIDGRGRLTLVECKLWSNPESRRKVVAQILDYAKELSRWSYADLQREVSARTKLHGNVVFDLIKASHTDLVEQRFADSVSKALRAGRFLLLIAGDGIREDVQAMGELINRNATSGFSFGMFEVGLYEGPGKALLVQPRCVARTQIIQRSVVVLHEGRLELVDELSENEDPQDSPAAEAAKKVHAEAEAWWGPVLIAPLDDPEQPAFRYRWPHNIRGSLPWPGTWITGFRTTGAKATLGVFVSGQEVARTELLRAIAPEIDQILGALPEGAIYEEGKTLELSRGWSEFRSDDERRDWLATAINAFVNQLRPRVERLREKV
ncbi:hypothetical protein [Rhizobacter fulvus]